MSETTKFIYGKLPKLGKVYLETSDYFLVGDSWGYCLERKRQLDKEVGTTAQSLLFSYKSLLKSLWLDVEEGAPNSRIVSSPDGAQTVIISNLEEN